MKKFIMSFLTWFVVKGLKLPDPSLQKINFYQDLFVYMGVLSLGYGVEETTKLKVLRHV